VEFETWKGSFGRISGLSSAMLTQRANERLLLTRREHHQLRLALE